MSDIDLLFHPHSIAIVGASDDPQKIGGVLVKNLQEGTFAGKIYPVNPKHTEILGLPCYANLSAIPEEIDIVCIAVPAPSVQQVVQEAADHKTKICVIISAGFRETGEAGIQLEQEIATIARQVGMRILGPNCLGALSPSNNLNLSFAASQALPGKLAVVSQSGALLTTLLDMSLEKNLGYSHLVSCGNKLDITENELLAYWLTDPGVSVIGAYLEEIADGQVLLDTYAESDQTKPFVVLKPGESKEATQAIQSHTGSLAGSSITTQTALEQTGIFFTTDISDFYAMLTGFSWLPPLVGKRIAIVTNAGGPGIIATDDVMHQGLELATLSQETQEKLAAVLPSAASVHNPVDVVGDAPAQRYKDAVTPLAQDEAVDAIVVVLTPQLVTQVEETARVLVELASETKKPLVAVFLGGQHISAGATLLQQYSIPVFEDLDDAVKVLGALYQFSTTTNQKKKEHNAAKIFLQEHQPGKYRERIQPFVTKDPVILPDALTSQLMEEVGITLPSYMLTSSLEEAQAFARQHYPVALKIPSHVLAHKTEEKGVMLNIENNEQLAEAWKKLSQTSSELLIQEQLQETSEVFVGAHRDGSSRVYEKDDPGFGHLLAFGEGGIYTEIFDDIQYARAPTTRTIVQEAFARTKISQILKGTRGQESLAYEKVIDVLLAVQDLVIRYPEIVSLDLNPLFVTKDQVVAVDVKVYIQQ